MLEISPDKISILIPPINHFEDFEAAYESGGIHEIVKKNASCS
jgi:hypothetical protein